MLDQPAGMFGSVWRRVDLGNVCEIALNRLFVGWLCIELEDQGTVHEHPEGIRKE